MSLPRYWNNGTRKANQANDKQTSHYRHKTSGDALMDEKHFGIDVPNKIKSFKSTRQSHLVETFQFDKRTKTHTSSRKHLALQDTLFVPGDLFKHVQPSEAYSSDQDGEPPSSVPLTETGSVSNVSNEPRTSNYPGKNNAYVNFPPEFGDVSTREEQKQIAALIGELEAQTEKVSRAAKAISSTCSRSNDGSIGNKMSSSSCFASSSSAANNTDDGRGGRERRPSGSTFTTWSEKSNPPPHLQQFSSATVDAGRTPTTEIVQSLLKRTSMGEIHQTVDEKGEDSTPKSSKVVFHETEKALPNCDTSVQNVMLQNELPAGKPDQQGSDPDSTQMSVSAIVAPAEQDPAVIENHNDDPPENFPWTNLTEPKQHASECPIEPHILETEDATNPLLSTQPPVAEPANTNIPSSSDVNSWPSGHVYANPSSVFGGFVNFPDNKQNIPTSYPSSQTEPNRSIPSEPSRSNNNNNNNTTRTSPAQQQKIESSSTTPTHQERRLAILECEKNRLQHELAGVRRALMSAHSQRVARAAVDREAAAYYDSVARREQAVAKMEREFLERENAMTLATTEMKMRLTRQGMELASLLEQCEWLRKENSRLLENERRWEDHLRVSEEKNRVRSFKSVQTDTSEDDRGFVALEELNRVQAKSVHTSTSDGLVNVGEHDSPAERPPADDGSLLSRIHRYTSTSDGIVNVSPTMTRNQKGDRYGNVDDPEPKSLCKNVDQYTSTPDGIVNIPSDNDPKGKDEYASHEVKRSSAKLPVANPDPIESQESTSDEESTEELESTPSSSKKHRQNKVPSSPDQRRNERLRDAQSRRDREQREDALEVVGRKLIKVRERCERAIQVAAGQGKKSSGIKRCESGSSLLREAEEEESNDRIGNHVAAIFNPLLFVVEILGAELDIETARSYSDSLRSLEGSIGSQLVLVANAAAKLIASKEHTLADLAALLTENETLIKEAERAKASREELNEVKHGLLESPNRQMADLVQELARRGDNDNADRLRDVIQDFREDKRRTLDLILKLEAELSKVVAAHERTAETPVNNVKETELSSRNLQLEKKVSKIESLLEENRKQRIEAERSADRRGDRLQKFEKRLLAEVEKRKNFETLLREERKKREVVEAREREELIFGGRLRQEEVRRITAQQRQQERDREREREREREKEYQEMEQTLAAVEQERHTWRLMGDAAEEEAEEHRNENARLRALLDEAKRFGEPEYRENGHNAVSKPRDDIEEQIRRLTKELQEHEQKAEDEEYKALKLRELVKTLKVELNISRDECNKWKNQAKAGLDQSIRKKDVGYLTRAAAGDFVGLEDVAEALGLEDLKNELKREAVNASVQATETVPESEQLLKILKAVQSGSISSPPESLAELGKAVDLQIEQLKKAKEENATLLLEARKACDRRRVREEAWVRKCAALKQKCEDAQGKIQTWEQAGRKYFEMWKDVETHSEGDIKISQNDPSAFCSQCSQRKGGTGKPSKDNSFTIVSKCTCPENTTLSHPLPFWEYYRNLLSTVQATKHALFRMKAQLDQTQMSDSKHQEELATTKRKLLNVETEKGEVEKQVVDLTNTTENMKNEKITLEEKLRRVGFGFKTLVLGNGLDLSIDSYCEGENVSDMSSL